MGGINKERSIMEMIEEPRIWNDSYSNYVGEAEGSPITNCHYYCHYRVSISVGKDTQFREGIIRGAVSIAPNGKEVSGWGEEIPIGRLFGKELISGLTSG